MKSVNFNRRLGDGSFYKLGTAVKYCDGWRFISNVASHRSSRKCHPTMERCLPRWLGYPDHCESQVAKDGAADKIEELRGALRVLRTQCLVHGDKDSITFIDKVLQSQ